MSISSSPDKLQLEQDLGLQRTFWTIQRIGWAVMAGIVIAAVVGLFGSGPLSEATIEGPGWTVKYSWLVRRRAPQDLHVFLTSATLKNGKIRVWVSNDFFDERTVDRIVPPPNRTVFTGQGVVYEYAVDQPGALVEVQFSYRPLGVGPISGAIGLAPKSAVRFDQLVYP